MDCEHINITIFKLLCKKSKENSSICIYIAPCSTSWPSDVEGLREVTAYHSAIRKEHGERRMPIDKQGDYVVEGQG